MRRLAEYTILQPASATLQIDSQMDGAVYNTLVAGLPEESTRSPWLRCVRIGGQGHTARGSYFIVHALERCGCLARRRVEARVGFGATLKLESPF